MKKFVVTALLALSVMSLAACGSDDSALNTETTTEATTIEAVSDSADAETTTEAAEDTSVEETTETTTEA